MASHFRIRISAAYDSAFTILFHQLPFSGVSQITVPLPSAAIFNFTLHLSRPICIFTSPHRTPCPLLSFYDLYFASNLSLNFSVLYSHSASNFNFAQWHFFPHKNKKLKKSNLLISFHCILLGARSHKIHFYFCSPQIWILLLCQLL